MLNIYFIYVIYMWYIFNDYLCVLILLIMGENNKRGRLYIYGERGVSVSVMVPESKKEEVLVKLYAVLKEYENPATLVLEPLSKGKVKNATISKEYPTGEFMQKGDRLSLIKNDPEDDFRISSFEVNKFNTIAEDVRPTMIYVEVKALPNTKKKIGVGLYSADGKFYTNKIVDNKLVILEWSDQEAAEGYLDNLK